MPAFPNLARLADLLGQPAALALMRAHGGLAYAVPATTRGRRYKALEALIGAPAALALTRMYGGDSLYVPKLDGIEREQRNAAIRAAYDARSRAGERCVVAGLAREHDLTERQVWNILGSLPDENPSLSLFDPA